jgi:hypothetical protein
MYALQDEEPPANEMLNFDYTPTNAPQLSFESKDPNDDFDDFEEDEMTKRIREDEERIQNVLK